jgi:hypothetical protein
MLLRIFLPPDIAETESGDLIEAYRDSIYPQFGPFRADLWFVCQVAGYILRTRTTGLGNWILAGLMLCVLTTAFSAVRYRELLAPLAKHVGLMCGGLFIYACAAVLGTRPRNERDVFVLRLGVRWGVSIGVLWIVAYLFTNLIIPHGLGARVGMLLMGVAFLLPLASGSHGALKTGRARDGIAVAFWGGLVSGVMTFMGLVVIGYVLAFIPGFPGAEIPSFDHVYTATEYEYANVSDVLGGGFAHLFLINGALTVVVGTIGSCAAILLERTGRGHDVSDPT